MPSQTNDLPVANVTIRGAHTKSIVEIAQQLAAGANKVRQGKDDDFEKSKPLLKALLTWVLNLVVRSAVSVLPTLCMVDCSCALLCYVSAVAGVFRLTGFVGCELGLNIPALGVRSRP